MGHNEIKCHLIGQMRIQDHFPDISCQRSLRLAYFIRKYQEKTKMEITYKITVLYLQKCKGQESQGKTEELQYSSVKTTKRHDN